MKKIIITAFAFISTSIIAGVLPDILNPSASGLERVTPYMSSWSARWNTNTTTESAASSITPGVVSNASPIIESNVFSRLAVSAILGDVTATSITTTGSVFAGSVSAVDVSSQSISDGYGQYPVSTNVQTKGAALKSAVVSVLGDGITISTVASTNTVGENSEIEYHLTATGTNSVSITNLDATTLAGYGSLTTINWFNFAAGIGDWTNAAVYTNGLLTQADASLLYQPFGSYLTSVSDLNWARLINIPEAITSIANDVPVWIGFPSGTNLSYLIGSFENLSSSTILASSINASYVAISKTASASNVLSSYITSTNDITAGARVLASQGVFDSVIAKSGAVFSNAVTIVSATNSSGATNLMAVTPSGSVIPVEIPYSGPFAKVQFVGNSTTLSVSNATDTANDLIRLHSASPFSAGLIYPVAFSTNSISGSVVTTEKRYFVVPKATNTQLLRVYTNYSGAASSTGYVDVSAANIGTAVKIYYCTNVSSYNADSIPVVGASSTWSTGEFYITFRTNPATAFYYPLGMATPPEGSSAMAVALSPYIKYDTGKFRVVVTSAPGTQSASERVIIVVHDQ